MRQEQEGVARGSAAVATKFSSKRCFAEIFIRSPRLNFLKSFSGLGKSRRGLVTDLSDRSR